MRPFFKKYSQIIGDVVANMQLNLWYLCNSSLLNWKSSILDGLVLSYLSDSFFFQLLFCFWVWYLCINNWYPFVVSLFSLPFSNRCYWKQDTKWVCMIVLPLLQLCGTPITFEYNGPIVLCCHRAGAKKIPDIFILLIFKMPRFNCLVLNR